MIIDDKISKTITIPTGCHEDNKTIKPLQSQRDDMIIDDKISKMYQNPEGME